MSRWPAALSCLSLSVATVAAPGVPINPSFLPIVMSYASCQHSAKDLGSTDPVKSCEQVRTTSIAEARKMIRDAGAGANMLDEIKRLNNALNMVDRATVAETTKR